MMLFSQLQPDNVFTPQWWRFGDVNWWKVTLAAICTIGLYTLLYRENKFYRFVEHLFIGLATGFSLIGLQWSQVLYPKWWVPMVGKPATPETPMQPAYWAWALVIPLAGVTYTVFSRKHGWLSRIPIGIFVGLWAGQQLDAFTNRYLPQLSDTARPFIPNQLTLASRMDPIGTITISQAINNFIILITFILTLSYFLYSFEQKARIVQRSALLGRWLLMVGFGAIFGTTMMTRFSLFIDRAYFLLIEWLKLGPPA